MKKRLHITAKLKTHLNKFLAFTSNTSHFKSILSPGNASRAVSGRFPLTSSFPLLLTLPSKEFMHSLLDCTRTLPPKFVIGLRSTGEDTDARWKVADPSSSGCWTVPLTYLFGICYTSVILDKTTMLKVLKNHNAFSKRWSYYMFSPQPLGVISWRSLILFVLFCPNKVSSI